MRGRIAVALSVVAHGAVVWIFGPGEGGGPDPGEGEGASPVEIEVILEEPTYREKQDAGDRRFGQEMPERVETVGLEGSLVGRRRGSPDRKGSGMGSGSGSGAGA